MKQHLLSVVGVAVSVTAASAALADCGDVTISSMNWTSAEVAASIDAFILAEGYGCNVDVIVGDTVPTITSMIEKQQPDIAPEGWVDLQPELIESGIESRKLVVTGDILSDGGENGWWVPTYFADEHPEIRSIADALAHPELFPAPEDPGKGAVYNGPQGWGATIVTAQYFKAYKGEENGFVLIDPGSAAGLDGAIAKAFERKEPWLGFYWAPTPILGKYDMTKLDFGAPHDTAEWTRCNTIADCPDPVPNAWPKDRVQTLVTRKFADRADSDVMQYLRERSWSNATANKLLAWMTDNQATGEEGARHFLQNNEDLWTQWVSPEVAEKVRAAVN